MKRSLLAALVGSQPAQEAESQGPSWRRRRVWTLTGHRIGEGGGAADRPRNAPRWQAGHLSGDPGCRTAGAAREEGGRRPCQPGWQVPWDVLEEELQAFCAVSSAPGRGRW